MMPAILLVPLQLLLLLGPLSPLDLMVFSENVVLLEMLLMRGPLLLLLSTRESLCLNRLDRLLPGVELCLGLARQQVFVKGWVRAS